MTNPHRFSPTDTSDAFVRLDGSTSLDQLQRLFFDPALRRPAAPLPDVQSPPTPLAMPNSPVEALLALAQAKGVLTAANEATYTQRAKTDPHGLLAQLQAAPRRSYVELERTPEGIAHLSYLRANDPAAFQRLFQESYGATTSAGTSGATLGATLAGKSYAELERTTEGAAYLGELRRTNPTEFQRLFEQSYSRP